MNTIDRIRAYVGAVRTNQEHGIPTSTHVELDVDTAEALLDLADAARTIVERVAEHHERVDDVDDLTNQPYSACSECDEDWPCEYERARAALARLDGDAEGESDRDRQVIAEGYCPARKDITHCIHWVWEDADPCCSCGDDTDAEGE